MINASLSVTFSSRRRFSQNYLHELNSISLSAPHKLSINDPCNQFDLDIFESRSVRTITSTPVSARKSAQLESLDLVVD